MQFEVASKGAEITRRRRGDRTLSIAGVQITLSEARFVVGVTIVVLIVTTAPYLFAYASSPPDKQFMGILLDVPDTAQYFAWMRGSMEGFFISNRMTPEPNAAIFFNLLWWTLGRLSLYTHLGFAQVYQVFRAIAGALFLLATYFFVALVVKNPRMRKVAYLLITLSSGLGWVLVLGKYLTGTLLFPDDVYLPEPNSFLSIMAFPHFIISVFLILVIFCLFIIGTRVRRLRYAFLAGLVALVLGLEHAYDLLTVYTVLAVYVGLIALKRRAMPWLEVKSWMAIVLLSCAPALYFTYLTNNDPIWSRVLDQFVNAGVFTPDPFHLIILMGLVFLIAVATFDGLTHLRDRSEEELFLKAWFLSAVVLMYLPVEYQIHFLSGWQIPTSILATIGFFKYIAPAISQSRAFLRLREQLARRHSAFSTSTDRLQSMLAATLILVVILTNVYLWSWRFVDLWRHGYPFFLHRDEVAALHWLEQNTDAETVVLSSLTVGQFIPSLAGNTAFLAHWAQTVDFYGKRDQVQRFFAATTPDSERTEIVTVFDVDYIFYGPAERDLGDFDPASVSWLTQSFSLPLAQVYRVQRDALSSISSMEGAE